MRWAMLLCAALATTGAVRAQATELTEKDKRDGWVLLFDGKTTFGWTTEKGVSVSDGKLEVREPARATFEVPLPAHCNLFVEGSNIVRTLGNASILIGGGVMESTLTNGEPTKLVIGASGAGVAKTVKMQPVDMKPLFNGDNLDGWKVFPGKKSKFEAKDGEIQLHDGPGDLQTTAKYRNFILQLECKSNGKHLNSGVFFRCRANEYQNGYECQIQNGFGKEKEYTVDVFDPVTHKLFEKRKKLSGAIDWGTGSIYRRVPARSEVAKDHEWFTMTILAVDNHFATWVDGIQEVDWTDNRPPSDNARNGYRSEAGHISLQGHDPTTNLSFRNLRIQELP